MTSPLAAVDALLAPIIIAANKVRQVRDALPETVWKMVPAQLRAPMDALFVAVEAYDRKVGQLQDLGIFPRTPPG